MGSDWIDVDRLQSLTLAVTVLATALALCCAFLVRGVALKVIASLAFLALAAGGVAYHVYLDERRRDDCAQVWLATQRVSVPHCATGPTT